MGLGWGRGAYEPQAGQGPLQPAAASLEAKVLPWVSLGKNAEAAAVGGTGLERAEYLNSRQINPAQ